MNIFGVIFPLALYVFWLIMGIWVHNVSVGTKETNKRVTLTMYTLGFYGLSVLLSRETESTPPSYTPQQTVEEGAEREDSASEAGPGIRLIGKDGTPLQADLDEREMSRALTVVRELVQEAIEERATDIHLEPEEGRLKVRYRVDGMLQDRHYYPAEIGPRMISALKVLGGLDVAEKRRAQDGSFSAKLAGRSIDFRLATTATSRGEALAIRILDKAVGLRDLDQLGLSDGLYKKVRRVVQAPHGMLLACGPTGCGKTTTLYAAINELDTATRNVITIEDPIEYNIANVKQHNINKKAGIGFADLLKNVLRQDPDIIMVGEIRDGQTAEIAMQASQTGHFVYSTLHANESISAVFRLFDLGVPPYLVASSVSALLSQRLVRKLCENCKKPTSVQPRILRRLEVSEEANFHKPMGCERCNNTGYRGRTGVFELLVFNDPVRHLVRQTPSIVDLRETAERAGYQPMRKEAVAKAAAGTTSLQEALRATQ